MSTNIFPLERGKALAPIQQSSQSTERYFICPVLMVAIQHLKQGIHLQAELIHTNLTCHCTHPGVLLVIDLIQELYGDADQWFSFISGSYDHINIQQFEPGVFFRISLAAVKDSALPAADAGTVQN